MCDLSIFSIPFAHFDLCSPPPLISSLHRRQGGAQGETLRNGIAVAFNLTQALSRIQSGLPVVTLVLCFLEFVGYSCSELEVSSEFVGSLFLHVSQERTVLSPGKSSADRLFWGFLCLENDSSIPVKNIFSTINTTTTTTTVEFYYAAAPALSLPPTQLFWARPLQPIPHWAFYTHY